MINQIKDLIQELKDLNIDTKKLEEYLMCVERKEKLETLI